MTSFASFTVWFEGRLLGYVLITIKGGRERNTSAKVSLLGGGSTDRQKGLFEGQRQHVH